MVFPPCPDNYLIKTLNMPSKICASSNLGTSCGTSSTRISGSSSKFIVSKTCKSCRDMSSFQKSSKPQESRAVFVGWIMWIPRAGEMMSDMSLVRKKKMSWTIIFYEWHTGWIRLGKNMDELRLKKLSIQTGGINETWGNEGIKTWLIGYGSCDSQLTNAQTNHQPIWLNAVTAMEVVQLKLVAAHVSMAALQLWGPHPLFGPRNLLQGQSSKCLLNRCWPVLAALPFLTRFWRNIPNVCNWIPGSSLNYSNWWRRRVQCGENRSTHWTSFQRTAPWAVERHHETQRHSHTLINIDLPTNSGKRRHVPSNPDVASHRSSSSSSSSSSSPVSTHVEWGNTTNMYICTYIYICMSFVQKGS